MTWPGHVAVAGLLQGHPVIRIAWGFLSHAILDRAIPEYRPNTLHLTNPKTWPSHKPWIIHQIIAILVYLYVTKDLWALAGLLPDIIEVSYISVNKFFGIDTWMNGNSLFAFHRPNKKRMWTYKKTITLELVLLIAAIFIQKGVF